MAQRNPLNERNLGGGPAGQTRRSASSVKPVSAAAASVQEARKPETSKERKAAEQARKDKMAKKAAERQRKAVRNRQLERTAQAKSRIARGEMTAEEAEAEAALPESDEEVQATTLLPRVRAERATVTPLTENPQFIKWRRLNWVCMGAAIGFIAMSLLSMYMSDTGNVNMVFVVPSYIFLLAVIAIDLIKLRPMTRTYREQVNNQKNRLSPKQQKHAAAEKNQAEQAAKQKMAEKAARRRGNKSQELSEDVDL
ncbi:MAG: hypothetical protein FWD45_01715 [Coriobacteriia bacterium]|nr:hypothetical protein [Coriobacteriia bacterium]